MSRVTHSEPGLPIINLAHCFCTRNNLCRFSTEQLVTPNSTTILKNFMLLRNWRVTCVVLYADFTSSMKQRIKPD